jgi:hypothetical protein
MTRKTDIYEPEQIKAVIDFLKTEKNIIDITENAGISTITTDSLVLLRAIEPIYLQVGIIITIGTINYQVKTVDLKGLKFTIEAIGLFTTLSVAPFTKTLLVTKWNLAINYKFGSRIEINELLDLESTDPATKMARFPMIWLFINEKRSHDNEDFDYKTRLKLAFVGLSEATYRAQERLDNTIKPVLQPLETLFLETITSTFFTYMFNWEFTKLKYDDYYRYFYGSSDKNQMVLNAATDAIEIDLDITFQNQY